MDMAKTGKLIAARRRELGLTQEELGRRLSVTDKAVSKWERGICCPDLALIGQLAAQLHVSIVELLSGEMNDGASSYLPEEDESAGAAAGWTPQLDIGLSAGTDSVVSPYLFGENLEHTRSNVCRGLSAQMLRNRKFAGKPEACGGYSAQWYAFGDRMYFEHAEPYTRHDAEFYHMNRRLECNAQAMSNYGRGEGGMGQHELTVRVGVGYEFRMVARSVGETVVKVSLTGRNGREEYACAELTVSGGGWKTYEAVLRSSCSDDDADLRISLQPGKNLILGAVSLMPEGHLRGMRRDVIDRLKEMGVSLLRWPGGNFAGEYCWADGLMPSDMRAPFESYLGLETQPHSMGYDYHEISTDDFIALCREIGAEPYITINPAWNTPAENAAWVEYCNGGPETKYGRLRAERGFPEPYNVQFWSLGNEFGYGHMEGDNSPYGYCNIAGANGRSMLDVCPNLSLCSSGPYPSEEWSEHAAKPLSGVARLTSLHYYAPEPRFTDPGMLEENYNRVLRSVETARMKARRLRSQLSDMLKISYDEWNVWYAWYRPGSAIEGLFTALMLHMLMEEAEPSGIAVACHFEAINEGMIRVRPDGTSELTAAGQAFAMMKRHAGGSLRFVSSDAVVTGKESVLTATAVNTSFDRERVVTLPVCGPVKNAVMYTCEDPGPFSRFRAQDVVPAVEGGRYVVRMPAHSMLLLQTEEN